MFLLYWVPNLQKLSTLHRWGALLRIWRPSKTEECDMCSLNLWHLEWNTPGSPQTACRDIWRLAIETLSILSLHIFLNRIRSQIESRIENRKKPNGPNRKLNCLKKKKIPHTSCHFGLLLGLIDAVQCLHKLRTVALI